MSQDSPTAVVIDNPVIRMHPADNLVVARVDLPPGVPIDDRASRWRIRAPEFRTPR